MFIPMWLLIIILLCIAGEFTKLEKKISEYENHVKKCDNW